MLVCTDNDVSNLSLALSIRRSHPHKEPLQWLAILVERYGMVDVGDILEPVLKDVLR